MADNEETPTTTEEVIPSPPVDSSEEIRPPTSSSVTFETPIVSLSSSSSSSFSSSSSSENNSSSSSSRPATSSNTPAVATNNEIIGSKPNTATGSSRPVSRAPLSYDEVSRFHERQRQVKSSDEAYFAAFPELRVLLNDFVTATLKEQPENIQIFAHDFFMKYTPAEDDKGLVAPNRGLGVVIPHPPQE